MLIWALQSSNIIFESQTRGWWRVKGETANFFHATVSEDEQNERKKSSQCEDILMYLEAPSTKQCDRRSQ